MLLAWLAVFYDQQKYNLCKDKLRRETREIASILNFFNLDRVVFFIRTLIIYNSESIIYKNLSKKIKEQPIFYRHLYNVAENDYINVKGTLCFNEWTIKTLFIERDTQKNNKKTRGLVF